MGRLSRRRMERLVGGTVEHLLYKLPGHVGHLTEEFTD